MDSQALLSGMFAVIAPVFVVAALGFGWARAKLPYDSAFITTFAINVSTPCLVFSALTRMHIGGDQLWTMAVASVACIVLPGLISLPILLAARVPWRVYIPALSFPNCGNLGLPICLFAFGERGLSLGVMFFAAMAVGQFTIGPAIAAGRFNLKRLISTPVIYSVALALTAQLTETAVPKWISNTTGLMGNCAVPLMLFSLGVALARLRFAGTSRAITLSALRIVLGAAVGFGVSWAMDLDHLTRGVVILQSAMPVAVFNYLWALRYDNSPEEVAAMVLGSTALAFLVLPPLLLVVM
ncbi:permease [Skermanella stibiiresistens SB22]|uniref:Permease n=1 Tax=Skermanella stibiiresistens SB22 TaxID=1385369 RepID=W9GX83_9PROT|nr:AEC family transporter [Skermanella stibiiresistens]EWY37221.1 permease [Skermanella stibiiresistens SB22]